MHTEQSDQFVEAADNERTFVQNIINF